MLARIACLGLLLSSGPILAQKVTFDGADHPTEAAQAFVELTRECPRIKAAYADFSKINLMVMTDSDSHPEIAEPMRHANITMAVSVTMTLVAKPKFIPTRFQTKNRIATFRMHDHMELPGVFLPDSLSQWLCEVSDNTPDAFLPSKAIGRMLRPKP